MLFDIISYQSDNSPNKIRNNQKPNILSPKYFVVFFYMEQKARDKEKQLHTK